MKGKPVAAAPERAVGAMFEALRDAGARVLQQRDPAVLPKAMKNEAEIAGHRAAQARDGAALVRFLHWLSVEAPKGGIDELSAAAKLLDFRKQGGDLRDIRFDKISGPGPTGPGGHHPVTAATNRPPEINPLHLA